MTPDILLLTKMEPLIGARILDIMTSIRVVIASG